VQVRHLVAEAREIHLVRLHDLAQRLLAGEDHAHEALALGPGEVGHLAHVAREDDAAERGEFVARDANHATELVSPKHRAARLLAELAVHDGFVPAFASVPNTSR
jgi:hypothetical protein